MSTSGTYRDLFVHATTPGKLDLFQSLLDTKDLTFDEALALLSAVHVELEKPKAHPSSIYMRYAESMEAFHQQLPEVHDQVVHTWRAKRGIVGFQANSVQGFLGSQAKVGGKAGASVAENFVTDDKVEDKAEHNDHQETLSAESKEESETEMVEHEVEEAEEASAQADPIATEAAKAAHEAEHVETEIEESELPDEEEPPLKGGE